MKPLTQEQFEAIRDWLKPIIGNGNAIKEFANEFKPQPEQPTLIPFNLEEALKNPDRVVYRDGSKPLEWHWFKSKVDGSTIVSVRNREAIWHFEDGSRGMTKTDFDLFLLPEAKKEYFINVYDVNGVVYASKPFNSAEQAGSEMEFPLKFIKTISFTI